MKRGIYGVLCFVIIMALVRGVDAEVVWDGSESDVWSEGANWTGDIAPGEADDVLIPTGLVRYPKGFASMTLNNLIVEGTAVVEPAVDAVISGETLSGSGTIKVTRIAVSPDLVSQYVFTSRDLSSMTVDYAGEGDQSINRFSYGSLKTSGSGTKTLINSPESETVLSDSCSIGEGTVLSPSSLLLKISGVTFAFAIDGTLDFTASATGRINCEEGTVIVSLGSGGMIRVTDPNGLGPGDYAALDTSGTGSWNLAGLANAGTVVYSRSDVQPVSVLEYNNLTLSGTGNKTISSGTSVNGNLEVTAGADLVLDGEMTLSVTGDAFFDADAQWEVSVMGTSSDALDVEGSLELGDATLSIGSLSAPVTLASANSVSGAFSGLDEAATIQTEYHIHYVNDPPDSEVVVNQDPTPTSSGVDLRAYAAAEGVFVEFIAYDVESDGEIMLALLGAGGEVVWKGSVEVAAGPEVAARFNVPGLIPGNRYDFKVRDEVGKWWSANGVMVGGFDAELTGMSFAGATITFDSVPGQVYEIQWAATLGAEWKTVDTVHATGIKTSVFVEYPLAGSASTGFFKARLK